MKKLFLITLIAALTLSFAKNEDWYLLETKNYKILFPKKPTASTQKVNSAAGELVLNMNMYEVPENATDDNLLYIVNETAYPDTLISSDNTEKLEDIFKGAINGAVTNVNGKLISEKTIELNKFPGREIKVDYQKWLAIIRARMYLVKSTLFMVQTITYTSKDNNKSIDKFMDSFQLIE